MTKKLIVGGIVAILTASSAIAAKLDTKSAEASWTAFKTSKKVAVTGNISNGVFKFKKTKGSVKDILEGASANLSALKIDLNDPAKNENIQSAFVSALQSPDIYAHFHDVIEGENLGTLTAKIKFNDVEQNIPMQYTISDGKIVVKGVIDLNVFGANKALESLGKLVAELHENVTWSQVEVSFSAKLR